LKLLLNAVVIDRNRNNPKFRPVKIETETEINLNFGSNLAETETKMFRFISNRHYLLLKNKFVKILGLQKIKNMNRIEILG